MYNSINYFIIIFSLLTLASNDLFAQQMQNSVYGNYHINPEKVEKPSETELGQFVNAIRKVNAIENKFDEVFISVLEEGGLSLERFNEIKRDYKELGENLEATETEKEKFQFITKELTQSQIKMKNSILKAVEASGLEIKRYEEILLYTNDNPELMKKVKSMLKE